MDNNVIDGDCKKVSRLQDLFRQIVRIAEQMGMKANSLKTLLLCISDSCTYDAGAFIIDSEGNQIESNKAMKSLAFTS